ncbi:tol-pal system protein YbgF [Sneathiella sp. CAU 1612]|uniref:Cell division coordinator CpoB n=1 Tax=Sneathiella sedimenti TaxID=2816034 RepID=A0ABS3F4H9_9PROT|nr:tol-pal system protein YbgF [Sneathiella sedimenti]MBO0333426.1 tol-pal system protein YbgF [Sneathiella sedimenti]
MIWTVSKTGTGKSELSGNGKILISCLILAMATFLLPALAQAQSSGEIRALVDRINRLEQDITDMQRSVYSGGAPAPRPAAPTSSTLPATTGGSVSQDGLALLLQRISALEDEQRRLTGAQEEASFKINQMTTRLDKLVKDVDFRLTDIERRLGGSGAATGGLGANATSGATGSPAPLAGAGTSASGTSGNTATGPVVVGGESLSEGSKVLGTLPANSNTTAGTSAAAGTAVAATTTGGGLPAGSASDQYNYAISLIREDRYDDAEAAFTEFLKLHKDSDLAGNAQYWLGETFYVRGDFPNAASAFFEGYQNYPDSTKAADNLLKLAMTLGRMDQKEEACATFAQMNKQFNQIPARLRQTADREKQKFGCK